MPFIPVPETAEVEVIMDLYGQRVENTLYFQKDGGHEVADLVALGSSIIDWWVARYAAFATADVQLLEVIVTDISSDTAPSIAIPAPAGTFGEAESPALPGNVTLTITFRTAGRGRSARGRNYVVGIGESQVVGNDAVAPYRNLVILAYNDLLSPGVEPDGENWVVVSRFSDNAPRVAGVTQLITSTGMADSALDSQRRRLRGRGQ